MPFSSQSQSSHLPKAMNFRFSVFCIQILGFWTWRTACWESNSLDELSEMVTKNLTAKNICDEECCSPDIKFLAGSEVWSGLCVGYRLLLFPSGSGDGDSMNAKKYVWVTGNGCVFYQIDENSSETEQHCSKQRKKVTKCKKRLEKPKDGHLGDNPEGKREIKHAGNEKEINAAPGTKEVFSETDPHPTFKGGSAKEVNFPEDLSNDDKNWKNCSSDLRLTTSPSSLFLEGFFVDTFDSSSRGKVKPGQSYGIIPEKGPCSRNTRSSRLEILNSRQKGQTLSSEWSPCTFLESFFNDSCYFVGVFKYLNRRDEKLPDENQTQLYNLSENSTHSCRFFRSDALRLAVETKKENRFVMDLIKSKNFTNNTMILTSGIFKKGWTHGQWLDWNLEVNESVIDHQPSVQTDVMLYAINSSSLSWRLLNFTDLLSSNNQGEWFVMCKRSHNFRNIDSDLYQQCLKEYRASECYNPYKVVNYCCAVDEKGSLWLGCPKEIKIKKTPSGAECTWYCGDDGLFVQEYPICRKETSCDRYYRSIRYMAAAGRHAIASCPSGLFGYSTWFCNYNHTFSGSPNYICCKRNEMCKAIDSHLNIWMACPGQVATKRVICQDALLTTAVVKWYCTNDLKFREPSPDYSVCNNPAVKCIKTDRYNRKWEAPGGAFARKICPQSNKKKCFWKCNKTGHFDTPEPDCSKCLVNWTNNITEHIKNKTHYTIVMEIIENHTRIEDLTIGFSQVLNLTSDCVDLFKQQSITNETQFKDFLVRYSKILKNVAGQPKIWSTFLVSSRREYAKHIVEMTQEAAFSYLSFPRTYHVAAPYNATLANFENDGFDFFVLYGSTPSGTSFPLDDSKNKNWRLEINEVNGNGSSFATMGLIMNYSLSHLMFPLGNATSDLKINSPAVTLTVATLKDKKPNFVPNVSVSVTFKHINKTKFPASKIVRRRLYDGETPSGVFGSTVCYYLGHAGWDDDGCSVTQVSDYETQCTCPHLSTIGLLMSVHHYEPDTVLEMVSVVSSVITIVSLFLTLLVFIFFDSVKNERILIGVNLCICLMVGHLLVITVMDKRFFYIPDDMCAVYAVLIHYVFMAAFAWMFLEGCHLYRMLVLVFESDIEYRCIYIVIGYGMPGVIIGLTELIGFGNHEQPYGEDELCWLKTPNYVWAFIGPVILLTSINFAILIKAMKLAIASKVKAERSHLNNLKIWIKGCFSLSALLGITWLFGLAYVHYNQLLAYIFVILNGLQGLFIFLFRVVCNKQYKAVFLRKLRGLCSITDDFGSFKKPAAKSGTKLFAITPTGTGSEEDSESISSGHRKNFLTKCLKLSLFMSKESNTPVGKPGEDETSSGIGLEYDDTVSSSQGETFRKRFLKNETDKDSLNDELSIKANKGFNLWIDPNDFPELSYHTNHYRL